MKGYTFLELLVTLIIIVILFSLAQPAWYSLVKTIQRYQQVNQLMNTIKFTRSLAIQSHTETMICPKSSIKHQCGNDFNEGLLIYKKYNNDWQLVRIINALANASLMWNRSSKKIVFSKKGFLKSQNGSFNYEVNDSKQRRKVILSSTGRIRVTLF